VADEVKWILPDVKKGRFRDPFHEFGLELAGPSKRS